MNKAKIDLSYLKTIAGNDNVFIEEMLGMILKSVPKEIENMQQHFDAGNYLLMASAAHKIKAPLQMIAEDEMVELILLIETTGRKSLDVSAIPQMLDRLKLLFEDVNVSIKETINTLT
jgi:HPt (histidine-containing phosphotransfer) domain-containing protein